jgi:hypothetical protein
VIASLGVIPTMPATSGTHGCPALSYMTTLVSNADSVLLTGPTS